MSSEALYECKPRHSDSLINSKSLSSDGMLSLVEEWQLPDESPQRKKVFESRNVITTFVICRAGAS